MSMGLSLHNSIAVIEGYIGRKTPFVRTPKFAVSSKDGQWTKNKYRALRANPLTLVELLLAGYFAFGLYMAHYLDDFGLFPFHLMLTFGFIAVSFYSVRHSIS